MSYEIPYVLLSGKEPEDAEEAKSIEQAKPYGTGDVKKGDLIWKQKDAENTSIPNHEEVKDLEFEFVGWYKANGFAWDYDVEAIIENIVLYPVWRDKNGSVYKVKVSEKFGVCYSIKEEPAPSGAPVDES